METFNRFEMMFNRSHLISCFHKWIYIRLHDFIQLFRPFTFYLNHLHFSLDWWIRIRGVQGVHFLKKMLDLNSLAYSSISLKRVGIWDIIKTTQAISIRNVRNENLKETVNFWGRTIFCSKYKLIKNIKTKVKKIMFSLNYEHRQTSTQISKIGVIGDSYRVVR